MNYEDKLKRDTFQPGLSWNPRSRVSNISNKGGESQVIPTLPRGRRYEYASYIPKQTRAWPGPTLRRRATGMLEVQHLNLHTLKSGKQPSLTRGHACRPSVDNTIMSTTYVDIVLALYS
jgi:hypothetical protein